MRTFLLFLLGSMIFSPTQAQNNPVVVELFTSQGCSSCPDADKNLTQILEQAKKEGKQVYGLSFHVDYWNYIGWKDPYSSKAFTQRQREYASVMSLRSIYTPQMIVNGKEEFVGSNRTEARKAIENEAQQKSVYQISIKELLISNGMLNLRYTLDKQPEEEVINVAVVEREIENYVPRGENSGKKLQHNNVVRAFVTGSVARDQKIQMKIPSINLDNASIILYIQKKDMHIIGAISQSLHQ
jgi:hypothetical protein